MLQYRGQVKCLLCNGDGFSTCTGTIARLCARGESVMHVYNLDHCSLVKDVHVNKQDICFHDRHKHYELMNLFILVLFFQMLFKQVGPL